MSQQRLKKPRLSEEAEIREAIANSSCTKAGVLALHPEHARQKIQPSMREYFDKVVALYQIDTAHFDPHWGKKKSKNKLPIEDRLIDYGDTFYYSRCFQDDVKAYLYAKYGRRCIICGTTDWNGKPLRFRLDHISGNSHDYREANLRIICPNCDAQTDTFGGRVDKTVNLSRAVIDKCATEAKSIRQLLLLLGQKDSHKAHDKICLVLKRFFPQHLGLVRLNKKRPIAEAKNSTWLKYRLVFEEGRALECACCKRDIWQNGVMPLDVEHKDGNHTNNDPENLLLLCPNCHSQTDTHCINISYR